MATKKPTAKSKRRKAAPARRKGVKPTPKRAGKRSRATRSTTRTSAGVAEEDEAYAEDDPGDDNPPEEADANGN